MLNLVLVVFLIDPHTAKSETVVRHLKKAFLKNITSISDYCKEINVSSPKHPFFDIRKFEDNMKTVNAKQPPFRHEFYAVALKNEGDNTEVNGKFLDCNLFFNSPYQIITWDIKPAWEGWYIIFDRAFLELYPSWKNFII